MRAILFSDMARERLAEIARWTRITFGPGQSLAYRRVLEDRLRDADRGAAHLRPLEAFTGLPRHRRVQVLKAGEHFLLIAVTPVEIKVLDIVHVRSGAHRFLSLDPKADI